MKSSIKLGKIAGIRVGLHYSWFIIAALIAFSLWTGQFHQTNPSWGTTRIWIMALVTAVLFFVTLLLHELSHSLVAQAYGMKVTEITLFALGGVSQIQDEVNPDAKTEFWVAIAGPLASVAIGFGCLAAAARAGVAIVPPNQAQEATAVLVWLGYINLGLGVFNMIPGYPLDGGRVLRGTIWAVTKNVDRSTRIVARIGQLVAFVFIFFGVWSLFQRLLGFNGLWMAFIGWFLMEASRSSYAQQDITAAFQGMRVSEVMSRDCAIVNPGVSLRTWLIAMCFGPANAVSPWRTVVTLWDSLRCGMLALSPATSDKTTVADVMITSRTAYGHSGHAGTGRAKADDCQRR